MFGRKRRLPALVAVTATCAAALVTAAVTAAPPAAHADPAGKGLLIWGPGTFGQFGDGTTSVNPRLTPGPVPAFLTGVKQVGLGWQHAAVLKTDGTVWTWGDNRFDQLGDGEAESFRSTPAQVAGLTGIVQISLGMDYSLALKSDGTVWAWGDNSDGQLGIGSPPNDAPVPTKVLINQVVQIAAGDTHSLAIRAGGQVYGWGEADHGEVTGGTLVDQDTPIPVPGVAPATSIAAGSFHSLAVVNGQVIQWGQQPGAPGVIQVPTVMSGPVGVTQVAAGDGTSAALTGDGQLWTWGANHFGQLGNGTETSSTTPAQVTSLSGVVQVGASLSSMVARLGNGTVFGWGDNIDGEVGDGTTTQRDVPTQASGIVGATYIAAGAFNTAAFTVPVDFRVSLSPTGSVVNAGTSVTATVSIDKILGTSTTVTLSATGMPAAILVTFSRPIVAMDNQVTMTVRSLVSMPPGTYHITVAAKALTYAGWIQRAATFTVAIFKGATPGCSGSYPGPPALAIPDSATNPLLVGAQVTGCTSPHTNAQVQVIIKHPRRGDLRIELIGPDQTVYLLKPADPTDTAPDVDQIYAVPVTHTSTLAQTWTLRVTDVTPGDAGSLLAWAIAL